jgi:hypothetical protein
VTAICTAAARFFAFFEGEGIGRGAFFAYRAVLPHKRTKSGVFLRVAQDFLAVRTEKTYPERRQDMKVPKQRKQFRAIPTEFHSAPARYEIYYTNLPYKYTYCTISPRNKQV